VKQRKSLAILFIAFAIFLWWYYAAFIGPNHPKRPDNVPASATLVLQRFDAFWQYCWLDHNANKNRCKIFNRVGGVIRDEVFIPYSGDGPIPESRLKVGKGGDVDYVELQDGTFLIPENGYQEIRKELEHVKP
jgi:hypothetical protein